jgi:hypothetical protein
LKVTLINLATLIIGIKVKYSVWHKFTFLSLLVATASDEQNLGVYLSENAAWVKNIFPIYAHRRLIQTPTLSLFVACYLASALWRICVCAPRCFAEVLMLTLRYNLLCYMVPVFSVT